MIASIGTVVLSLSFVPFADQRRAVAAAAADGRRRPVAGQLAGVGDDVAAARAQLHVAAADPLRAPGVRPALDQPRRRQPPPARPRRGWRAASTTALGAAAPDRSTASRPATVRPRCRRTKGARREAGDDPVGRRTVYFVVIGALYWARRRRPRRRLAAADGHRARRARRRLDLGLAPAPPTIHGRRTVSTPTPRDETGVVGVYPTASLRPLALAVGITAAALGVVLGSWMTDRRHRHRRLAGRPARPGRRPMSGDFERADHDAVGQGHAAIGRWRARCAAGRCSPTPASTTSPRAAARSPSASTAWPGCASRIGGAACGAGSVASRSSCWRRRRGSSGSPRTFTGHMVQHLIVIIGAAPLLVLARPVHTCDAGRLDPDDGRSGAGSARGGAVPGRCSARRCSSSCCS